MFCSFFVDYALFLIPFSSSTISYPYQASDGLEANFIVIDPFDLRKYVNVLIFKQNLILA